MEQELELVLVTMSFETDNPAELAAVLSRYVVVSRGHAGCRNIDLAVSATRPGRFVIVQKWESPDAQRAHFDSHEMVSMAEQIQVLLTDAPMIDLLEPISAHDLR